MARPRKVDARDTRQAILDASLELFARSGYFGTGVRAIAKAAGLRESALYHYFDGKEAILDALLKDLGPGRSSLLMELDVETLAKGLGPKQMLEKMVELMLEMWATPQEMRIIRVMLSEGPRLSEAGVIDPAALFGQAVVRMGRLFSELMRLGYVRRADPQVCALAFMGPLIALRLRGMAFAAGKPEMKPIRAAALAHVEFFWQGVEKQNTRSVSGSRERQPWH